MEIYSFESQILTIIDPELKISYRENFDPIMLPESLMAGQSLGNGHTVCVKQGEDGALLEAYVEKEGCLHGQYLLFYPESQRKQESFYYQGELHGPSIFYGRSGNVLGESWFIHGKCQGKRCLYYASGALYSLQRFHSGLWHGAQEYYYPDGTPKTLLHYEHGKLVGSAILYNTDGQIKREVLAHLRNTPERSADL